MLIELLNRGGTDTSSANRSPLVKFLFGQVPVCRAQEALRSGMPLVASDTDTRLKLPISWQSHSQSSVVATQHVLCELIPVVLETGGRGRKCRYHLPRRFSFVVRYTISLGGLSFTGAVTDASGVQLARKAPESLVSAYNRRGRIAASGSIPIYVS
jgi:hypothetical protein